VRGRYAPASGTTPAKEETPATLSDWRSRQKGTSGRRSSARRIPMVMAQATVRSWATLTAFGWREPNHRTQQSRIRGSGRLFRLLTSRSTAGATGAVAERWWQSQGGCRRSTGPGSAELECLCAGIASAVAVAILQHFRHAAGSLVEVADGQHLTPFLSTARLGPIERMRISARPSECTGGVWRLVGPLKWGPLASFTSVCPAGVHSSTWTQHEWAGLDAALSVQPVPP